MIFVPLGVINFSAKQRGGVMEKPLDNIADKIFFKISVVIYNYVSSVVFVFGFLQSEIYSRGVASIC